VAQLQPIHALYLACSAQRALLPVAVGAINIHDVRDNASLPFNARLGGGGIKMPLQNYQKADFTHQSLFTFSTDIRLKPNAVYHSN